MRGHHQKRQARSDLLVARARNMLHAPTASEDALWQVLRGNAPGVAFKRQVPLGNRYIADFYAPSVRLVVEVDGGVHRSSRSIADFYAPSVRLVVEVDGGVHRSSRAADCRRDEWLRRRGYRVVRVGASHAEAAIALVRRALTEYSRRHFASTLRVDS